MEGFPWHSEVSHASTASRTNPATASLKKPDPIKFRAIHTKTRWRNSDHETMANALGKTRGARALFDHLNKSIDYATHGESKYVIDWHENANDGEIIKARYDQWNGLRHAPISRVDIDAFEQQKMPLGDEVLEKYFLPPAVRASALLAMPVSEDKAAEVSTLAELEADLQQRIERSRQLSAAARHARLQSKEALPRRVDVQLSAFVRSADVIVEVLERAQGTCEACHQPAPFTRARDGSPYREVHHRIPLSLGGEDAVENAAALCPNCHRFCHYGGTA